MKWAVLSDLHMNFKNCNTLTARDKLIEALRKENTDGEISFVLITGDCLHQNRGNGYSCYVTWTDAKLNIVDYERPIKVSALIQNKG